MIALPLLKRSWMQASFPVSRLTAAQRIWQATRREDHRGLDGLRERLAEYAQMDLRFAKWRRRDRYKRRYPQPRLHRSQRTALARYAALCQEVGLVPIVEPEVLMDGEHELERCRAVTEEVLRTVFSQLYTQRVLLEG